MTDGSLEENIQFSLKAIDLDEDIETTDELLRNEDVEEDCVLSEEEKNPKKTKTIFFYLPSLLLSFLI